MFRSLGLNGFYKISDFIKKHLAQAICYIVYYNILICILYFFRCTKFISHRRKPPNGKLPRLTNIEKQQ